VLFWIEGSRLFDNVLPSEDTFNAPAEFAVPIVDPSGKKIIIPSPAEEGLDEFVGGSAGSVAIEGDTGTHPPTWQPKFGSLQIAFVIFNTVVPAAVARHFKVNVS
jgi:hypothetical protein